MRRKAYVLAVMAAISLCVYGVSACKPREEPQPTPSPQAEPTSGQELSSMTVYEPSAQLLGMLMLKSDDFLSYVPRYAFLRTAENLSYPAKLYLAADEKDAAAKVDDMKADGCGGALILASTPGFAEVVNKADSLGIRVIVPYYRFDTGSGASNVVAQEGEYIAEAMRIWIEAIKAKYPSGKIAVCSAPDTKNLAEMAMNELMNNSPYQVEEYVPAEAAANAGAGAGGVGDDVQTSATDYVMANGDIVGVLAFDGSAALWAQAKKDVEAALKPTPTPKNSKATPAPSAVHDPTKRNIMIVALDYTPENIAMVKAGTMYGIIARPYFDAAAQSTMLLDNALRGKQIPLTVSINAPLIRANGVAKYESIAGEVKKWFSLG